MRRVPCDFVRPNPEDLGYNHFDPEAFSVRALSDLRGLQEAFFNGQEADFR